MLREHVGRSTDQRLLLAGGRASCQAQSPKPPDPQLALRATTATAALGPAEGAASSLSPAAWACLPTITLQANLATHPAPGSPSHHLPQTAGSSYSQGNQARENAAVTTPGECQAPSPDRDIDPSPGLRTQTQIAPKSPTTHVTEPRDSTEGNHRPQIRRRLGAEPRPEPPSLLSPDTWRPSLPTAHLGPTRSQRLGHTRDHPSSPHHGQTR